MTVASGKINLQGKDNLICPVAKVKAATSAHSMADVVPFFSVFNIIPFELLFRTLMFQQLLANKHHRLRDSVPIMFWPSGGLGVVTDKKKKEN